jgi:hypothetical protein
MKYQVCINRKSATSFEARNDNHAIRRIIKTLRDLGRIYSNATIATPGGEQIDVSYNQAGTVWVRNTQYSTRTDWCAQFPG